jgi:O-antigen/teichoic acid export membrane protein
MSIESKAISAFKWATGAKFVLQIASWAATLVVVRLLTPEDYGLMAKVAVVCAITGAVAELGLEAAIVRSVDIARDELRKIYGVALLFGAGMTASVAAAAPLLAGLFREPRLTWPIAVASLQMLIAAASIVPSALATRDLSFRKLATIEMAAGMVSIAATLLLAVAGSGVWALVVGTLLGAIARGSGLLVLGDRVWPTFSMRGIGEQLKFGMTVVGNRLSYFIIVQSDVLIGSAFLSTTQIGQYSVALQLATMPLTKFMGTINQITLPAVARQQSDPVRVRAAVLKAVGVISLLAFPCLWGISAVAPELVQVLFGANWLDAIPALAILPLVMPLRMVCGVIYTTSLAMGNRQLDLSNTVINLILLPTGFFVGSHWGLVGLCSSWLVSVPIAYLFTMPAVLRILGIRPLAFIAEFGAPAAAGCVMYAAVAAARLGFDGRPAIVTLPALILVGAVVYFAAMALLSPRHLLSARAFARALLGRDAAKSA